MIVMRLKVRTIGSYLIRKETKKKSKHPNIKIGYTTMCQTI